MFALHGQKLLCHGVEQLVSLGFFVGCTVRMNGSDLGNFIQLAGEFLGILGSGSGITGCDCGTQMLFNGFELADAGTVAEISRLAGTDTLDRGFNV